MAKMRTFLIGALTGLMLPWQAWPNTSTATDSSSSNPSLLVLLFAGLGALVILAYAIPSCLQAKRILTQSADASANALQEEEAGTS